MPKKKSEVREKDLNYISENMEIVLEDNEDVNLSSKAGRQYLAKEIANRLLMLSLAFYYKKSFNRVK